MGGIFSKSKPEAKLKPSRVKSDPINKLHKDEAGVAGHYLSLQEMEYLARTSRQFYQFFQSVLTEAKEVQSLLAAVVLGNPEALETLVTANPALLFKKGQVTDLNDTTFYDVSPYLLLTFLWEGDMKRKIMSLVSHLPEALQEKRKQQYATINSGGADLVKMGQDPMVLVAEEKFADIMQFKATYTIDDDEPTELTFSLLENPDGILYYQDEAKKVHFYYANLETKTVAEIEPQVHSQQEQEALKALKALFATMEVNSSLRSSNAEHQLIANTMQHQLQRKGILYERNGERFRDSHADFNLLLNAYRRCISLYAENKLDEGDKHWREEVGDAQRNVIWLLQRLCEKGQPFDPWEDFNKDSPFHRGASIFSDITGRDEVIMSTEGLLDGLGSNFAIFKLGLSGGHGRGSLRSRERVAAINLIGVCRLVEDAKVNVVEFTAEQDLPDSDANLPRGPG